MRLLSLIEAVSTWSGKAVSFLLFITIAAICYEVVARHVFGAPTIWAFEVIIFSIGVLHIIGGAYTQQHRRHVIVDVIYSNLPPRGRAITDIVITFPIITLYCGILIYMGGINAWEATIARESSGTLWDPPIYPILALIPLGAFLLLLQNLAKLIRDTKVLITGRDDIKTVTTDEVGEV